MLRFDAYKLIADDVYDQLEIPEDIYLTFDKKSANEFRQKYLLDDYTYIYDMVDEVMQAYDTSDMMESDVEDIRETAVEEVLQMLEDNLNKYEEYNHQVVVNTYREIISLIRDSDIDTIVDVDTEYQPSDPDVGIWDEERSVMIKLTNGAVISFDVEFDED